MQRRWPPWVGTSLIRQGQNCRHQGGAFPSMGMINWRRGNTQQKEPVDTTNTTTQKVGQEERSWQRQGRGTKSWSGSWLSLCVAPWWISLRVKVILGFRPLFSWPWSVDVEGTCVCKWLIQHETSRSGRCRSCPECLLGLPSCLGSTVGSKYVSWLSCAVSNVCIWHARGVRLLFLLQIWIDLARLRKNTCLVQSVLERYSHEGYIIKVVIMALAGEVTWELSPIRSWSNKNYEI